MSFPGEDKVSDSATFPDDEEELLEFQRLQLAPYFILILLPDTVHEGKVTDAREGKLFIRECLLAWFAGGSLLDLFDDMQHVLQILGPDDDALAVLRLVHDQEDGHLALGIQDPAALIAGL